MSLTQHPLIIDGCSATLHLPRGGVRRVVVLVNTFGYEGAYTVRAWTALGEDLARAGVALLRFDLPDQGDSRDLPPEADAARAWLDSVVAMVHWVRARYGHADVGLCGYRLGALLAAQAATRLSGLCGLALLAPVAQGRSFVRELKLHTGADAAGSGLRHEGWWLSAASLQTLSGWSLSQLPPETAPPIFALADNGLRALEQWLGATPAHSVQACDELAKLRDEPHLVEVPETAFAALVHWWHQGLQANAGTTGSLPAVDPAPRGPQVLTIDGGTEEPLRFGPDGQWPGTWCFPTQATEPRRSVLILSTGGNPRSGHSRLSVRLARTLALQGVASLRVDCQGIGEATPVLRTANLGLYRDAGFEDVQAALDEMQGRGFERPVVYGLCSGAYVAYQTALESPRMSALVLANLYSFQYERPAPVVADTPGAPAAPRVLIKPVETYFKVIRTRDFWRRLLRGRVNVRAVITQVAATYGRRLRVLLQGALPGQLQLDPRVRTIRDRMRQLMEARLPVLLVYGDHDPGLNDLTTVFGKAGRLLTRHPWVRLEMIPHTDHTFTSDDAARHVIREIAHFVAQLPEAVLQGPRRP